MIPNSNRFPGIWVSKIDFEIFRGRFGRGQDAANFWHRWKDAQENSTSFDINVVLVGGGANMVFNEKLTKNRKLRGLKLRGLRRNQINTPNFTYGNVQRNKTNLFGDFENWTPTHIGTTHAFSKILQNFRNRIPKELDKNFYIPRISMIHWIRYNFLK